MPRKKDVPAEFEALLEGVIAADIPKDPFEVEHMMFLRHHPGFLRALSGLREDLVGEARSHDADIWHELGKRVDFTEELVHAAIADPEAMDYPARKFAEEWGITVAAAYHFALLEFRGPVPTENDLPPTEHFAVRRTSMEYVIRLPRPITTVRKQALIDWLKQQKEPGPAEKKWGKAGKGRYDLSGEAVALLPWFERWNADPSLSPSQVYFDMPLDERPSNPAKFAATLVRIWERMREISDEGIRRDQPSRTLT